VKDTNSATRRKWTRPYVPTCMTSPRHSAFNWLVICSTRCCNYKLRTKPVPFVEQFPAGVVDAVAASDVNDQASCAEQTEDAVWRA
jgi:hypothetical protein